MRRALREAWRAVRRSSWPVAVWYHPSFRVPLAGIQTTHGFDPRRAEAVLTYVVEQGLVRESEVHEPGPASWEDLALAHEAAWLEKLDSRETIAQVLAADPRVVPVGSLLDAWRHATGAVLEATRHVLSRGGVGLPLLGGFHHAWPDRGAGFCAINDIAIAIARLRADGESRRIGILDLDAHPPDGLAACLVGVPEIRLGSVSREGPFPRLALGVDVRLPPKPGAEAYLEAVQRAAAELDGIGLLFYLAGGDPLAGDRLGDLGLTLDDLRRRDALVFARFAGVPTVAVPAGGYHPHSWRVFAGTVAEAVHDSLRVPLHYDPLFRRTLAVSRLLDPHQLGPGADDLTAADLDLAFGHPPPDEPRLLGFYSRQGLEYGLSRYGLLDALRRMGFLSLQVELLVEGGPERVRITADVDGRREVLVEVALSKRRIEGYDTLFVEWMLLRDPRRVGDPSTLPGQDAPGLGLAPEAGAVLLAMAHRLHLAGVSLVPSHFHVAWMAKDAFRFVEPDKEKRFRELLATCEGRKLEEVSREVEATWEPGLMLHALNPELEAAVRI